jgi:hypothetical protein
MCHGMCQDVSTKIDQQQEERLKFIGENDTLREKLKQLLEQFELQQKHFDGQVHIAAFSWPGAHCSIFMARCTLQHFQGQVHIAAFSGPGAHCSIFITLQHFQGQVHIAAFSGPGAHDMWCDAFKASCI